MRQTRSQFSCIIMCLSIWNNYTEITELRIYYFFNRTHHRNTDACLLNQTNNISLAFQSLLSRFVKDGTSGHKLGSQEWLLVVINNQHLSAVTKRNLQWRKCRYSPGEMIADSLDLLLFFFFFFLLLSESWSCWAKIYYWTAIKTVISERHVWKRVLRKRKMWFLILQMILT